MNNNENGYPDLNNLDPAVACVLTQGNRRQIDMHMDRTTRKKTLRERQKAAARRGKRALYDLPEELIQQVKSVAEAFHTTASQVAGLGLHLFMDQIESGEIDLNDYLIPIDNPRYENLLSWEKEE